MNVVGKFGSLISQGVYSVATPFHPFGGAVDVIVVRQQDGTFRSTPWYVRFGKFQGVLKGAEKVVHITVNGVEANFHMCLDNSGEAYFAREVDAGEGFDPNGGIKDSESEMTQDDGNKHIAKFCRFEHSVSESRVALLRDELDAISPKRLERTESDTRFYEFQDEQFTLEDSINLSEMGADHYEGSDGACLGEAQDIGSEVVLFSVDGHVLTAPVSDLEQNVEDVQLSTPRFLIGPDEGPECCNSNEEIILSDNACAADCTNKLSSAVDKGFSHDSCGADSDSTALRQDHEVSQDGREHAFQTEESPKVPNHQSEFDGPSEVRDAFVIKKTEEVFKSCLKLSELDRHSENTDPGDIPTCIPPNFNESEDEANDDSGSEDVPSSSNNNGSPDLQAENEVLDSDYLGSNNVSVGSVGNESQGEVEQLVTSASTEGINSSLQRSEPENTSSKSENVETECTSGKETEDCANPGMGFEAATAVFEEHHMSNEEYKNKASSIIKNADLNVQFGERCLPRENSPSVVLGTASFGSESIVEPQDAVPVERAEPSNPKSDDSTVTSTSSSSRWKLWPIPFIKGKTLEHPDNKSSNEKVFVDTEPDLQNSPAGSTLDSPHEQFTRTNVPTTEQIASLNLKDGQNMVIFSFSTRVFGNQQVDAHLYLWKWNDKIVISDVDGTITKSDVLGQFMPLVGRDWTQYGVAKLFSAIKENGYQLLFLSARAIVQAYITRNFLLNLKQDGKALPSGPVVISPDGLFPSLYREVIRRAPHEFKISCLEDIKKLFPSDHNPFYAGFGNRDTDELSYRKIGIPKGKIFIINPKGEVAISHCNDARSYTSLHTLVDDMFPPASLVEQEDFNSWNFWKVPLPDIK
ncbi:PHOSPHATIDIC ACID PHOSPHOHYDROLASE 1 [Hibiscus trionum]|uniref:PHOSPHATIDIC ACID PHOSPHOHYDROLASE 1 n=1 Tax=Hibiscus trionum TaxID=183268 RepID=A0A9W7MCI4_HIBTR|nr:PHOSPHATIDIC ACID PHOSPHOHYDROLASE 1 [Hibiscus trionum]